MPSYNHMVAGTPQRTKKADRLFFALSDATRRDIVTQALDRERSVSELGRLYPISLTAVQKHIAVLERATLVTKERRGREQIVHANGRTIAKARALLDQYEALWIHRAKRIADVLATADEGEQP